MMSDSKFFAAYFVQFAHTVVGFVHLLSYSFVVVAFQSVAYVEYTLDFFDDVFSTFVVFFANFCLDFVQHVEGAVAQEFYLRVFLLEGCHYVFAALAALVVG